MTLKEAIARALCLSRGVDPDNDKTRDFWTGSMEPHPDGAAWRRALPEAEKFITALNASGTHVVVPVEPTVEMIVVGETNNAGCADNFHGWASANVYRAMLSASLTHSEGDR